ncbi:CKLF-like MARVEL transmembrane domain-containing protein 5 isoform X2 [Mustela putorius furo]|uniref:CKLF-like MARVEL transmembrane domain-containing protein 5 isoform X2 n=2 Tax=Mustelinae TaxID=169418 RepID=A0A8U0RJH8_MUSPF|nr:CKLF-like MARVEL transmembrane domain-containing protein 5 isoform X2 [Mustela putorius furo]
MCFPGLRGGGDAGTSRGTLGSWEKARLAGRGSLAAPRPTSPLLLQASPSASLLLFASPSLQVSVFPVPFLGRWQWGLCLVGPTEMLSARDRRDGLPAEGAAAGLQGFAVDKTFLSSLKGILLETELDFLRCVSAIIIFLVVSFAAVTSRDGAAIAAFVFGIILVSVFAYDAFKIYRTEMAPRTTQEDQQ